MAARKKAPPTTPANDPRAAFMALPSRHRAALVELDSGPLVLRDLGFFGTLDLEGMGKRESIVTMLMRCVFRPVFGEDGQPLIGEDGQPLVGKPLFEKADEEYLRTTDHPIGGPVFRLAEAVSHFLGSAGEEAGVGKPLTTD